MIKIAFIFLKLSLLHYDNSEIDNYLHNELVINNVLISEEDFSNIHSIGAVSIISKKLTYAILLGDALGGIIYAVSLFCLTLIPNLLIFFGIIYLLHNSFALNDINYIINGLIPVLAAYFATLAFTRLKESANDFSRFVFGFIVVLSLLLIIVFEISIVVVVLLFSLFFLFFMKGGEIDD